MSKGKKKLTYSVLEAVGLLVFVNMVVILAGGPAPVLMTVGGFFAAGAVAYLLTHGSDQTDGEH
jgi:hypothetical protein